MRTGALPNLRQLITTVCEKVAFFIPKSQTKLKKWPARRPDMRVHTEIQARLSHAGLIRRSVKQRACGLSPVENRKTKSARISIRTACTGHAGYGGIDDTSPTYFVHNLKDFDASGPSTDGFQRDDAKVEIDRSKAY